MVIDPREQELQAMRAAEIADTMTRKRKHRAIALVDQMPKASLETGNGSKLMNVSYMAGGIKISEEDVARAGQRAKRALVHSKKLMLVLDLDHTLLNSKAEARLETQVCTSVT